MTDSYRTIESKSEGIYTELRSKFLAFAFPVYAVEEAMEQVAAVQKSHHDARHVCWAYMLGAERLTFRSNDNGEPSGTAGKPILGQINSHGLSNILIVVVRYFGGVKLGTSGLITAYKSAAAEAIANARIVEKSVEETVSFSFGYPLMNRVLKVVNEMGASIVSQSFDMDCRMTLSIRAGKRAELEENIRKALLPY